MKKIYGWVLLVALALACTTPMAFAQGPNDIYKQAYAAEAVERDPVKAIQLYKKVLTQTADEDSLAAKAHLRLGICYEKLGQTENAKSSYQSVLDMTEPPAAATAQAREHLKRLESSEESRALPPVREIKPVSPAESVVPEAPEPFHRGKFEVSFQGGSATALSEYGPFTFRTFPSTRPLLQWSVLYEITNWCAFGPELGYPAKFTTHGYSYNDGTSRSVFQFTPMFQFGPWIKTHSGAVKPYVTIGGGLYRTTDNVRLEEFFQIDTFHYGSTYVEHEETRNLGGVNAGLGMLFRLGDRFALGPDIRYHQIFDSGEVFIYGAASLRLAVLF